MACGRLESRIMANKPPLPWALIAETSESTLTAPKPIAHRCERDVASRLFVRPVMPCRRRTAVPISVVKHLEIISDAFDELNVEPER